MMSLEIIVGILIVVAVGLCAVVVTFANKEQVGKSIKIEPVDPFNSAVVDKPMIPNPSFAAPVEQRFNGLKEKLADLEDLKQANQGMRQDNMSLKDELQAMAQRYRDLLAQFDAFKLSADGQIAGLIKEKEMIAETVKNNSSQEVDQLKQQCDDALRTQEKLRELNNTMSLKADMLQYELIKSRAQATGFERICQNYRQQLDEMTGQLQGVNQDYTQLAQQKNRLESMISEIKQVNENLTHREKLAQLELLKRQG